MNFECNIIATLTKLSGMGHIWIGPYMGMIWDNLWAIYGFHVFDMGH